MSAMDRKLVENEQMTRFRNNNIFHWRNPHTRSAMCTHNRVNCEWCALFWFRVAKHSYSWTWMNVTSATWQTQKSIRLNFLLNVGSKQLRWHSFCSCSTLFSLALLFGGIFLLCMKLLVSSASEIVEHAHMPSATNNKQSKSKIH